MITRGVDYLHTHQTIFNTETRPSVLLSEDGFQLISNQFGCVRNSRQLLYMYIDIINHNLLNVSSITRFLRTKMVYAYTLHIVRV